MSATTALLILLVAWIVIGVVAAIIMGRRGHAPFSWLLLGAVLGPLVVPVMLASRERPSAPRPEPRQAAGSDTGGHGIDMLFGFDRSEDSKGALVAAIALFGPYLDRLSIATVLEFEASTTDTTAAEEELADVALLAAGLLERRPETLTLVGRPDEALVRHALGNAFDLLVIAPRGRGATRALFGSVASRLARAPHVPVAIMPSAERLVER